MNHSSPPSAQARIDRYHDGVMSAAERASFEREIAHDAALRAELEVQRSVDASLRRRFGGDARPAGETPLDDDAARALRPRAGRRAAGWALAAAVIVLLGGWIAVLQWQASRLHPGVPLRPLAQVYEQTVAEGFRPSWVCETEEEFIHTFTYRFGVPLNVSHFADPDPDRELILAGLSYQPTLSSQTVSVLATYEDRPVMVFIDRRDTARHPADPPRGLNLFRRDLGELVLYELTPLSKPMALSEFVLERPAASRDAATP